MAYAASEEILLYFSDFVHSGRSWFEFPRADINFVDGVLVFTYGIPATTVDPGVFERVEYHGDRRAGVFGRPGFLAGAAFCRPPCPPPPGRPVARSPFFAGPPP